MLIEFNVSNFRSFCATQTLSMVAGATQEHLSTHTFDTQIPEFDRLLRSVVIYGPNSAGKTNLLRALLFMKSFVPSSAAVPQGGIMPYTPCQISAGRDREPSEFEVSFIQQRVRY